MRHCDIDFEDLDTWFLEGIKDFADRRLIIGKCPICEKDVVILKEIRRSDGRVFENIQAGDRAEKIAKREKKRIVYTSRQNNSYSTGWTYGINTEIRYKKGNKKGQVSMIRQYLYDYATNKSKGKIRQVKV